MDLFAAAKAGAQAWAASEADLPHGEAPETAAGRVLGVVDAPSGPQIQLASDGLTLDRKLALERAVRQAIADALPATEGAQAARVSVYFRRAQGGPGAGPTPVKPKGSPFGLKLDRRAIPGVREVVVVASGKGGVGKSTVAVNLAAALAARGHAVGLLDADVYGPSAPLMLGLTGGLEVTEGDRLVPREAHGIKVVSFGFLTDARQPVIWRGPLVAKALKQFCYDVAWGDLDYLVVDLPPGTGDVQLTLIESLPIHGAVVVTTPQDVALIDAQKAITMFEKLEVPILGLVENMAHFCCPNCGHVEPVFGDGGGARMAAERKLRVLTKVPLTGAVRARSDEGRPVALDSDERLSGPFLELASQVAAGPV